MNTAYGAPKTSPIGWRPSTRFVHVREARRPGAGSAVLTMSGPQDCETSWLIFVAACESAWFGSSLPKITDLVHASRKVCHTSIELGTLGPSTTWPASAANVLYAGLAEKYAG